MRTKALLCAAALAAGAVTSMAQSNVYSVNVVGYVNYAFVPGFNLAANPLNAATNKLSALMSGANVPDNTLVYLWDTTIQDISATIPTFNAASKTWAPDYAIAPGQGFFVFAPANFTNTWVGDVLQGSITNTIKGSFNSIASPVPIGGDVSVVLTNMPAVDNDLAMKWDTTAQDFTTVSTYSAATKVWAPPVNFNVGEGIFYFYNGTSAQWVRNFTVGP